MPLYTIKLLVLQKRAPKFIRSVNTKQNVDLSAAPFIAERHLECIWIKQEWC